MANPTNNGDTLEILMSTMNRNSLSFLNDIFPTATYSGFSVLIVNQTNTPIELESKEDNIRLINSVEAGLAKSRNLLLSNAKGSICLIADDDIKYVPDFDKIVTGAFASNPEADIITFMMVNSRGQPFRTYPQIVWHDKKSVSTANSVVIAFRRTSILDSGIRFNEHFGLGAEFQTGDEYVFLRDALNAGLRLYFEPKIILSHPDISSGQNMGSDPIIYARAALFYKYSGLLGYLRLAKYLYLVYKAKAIKLNDIWPKYLKGIMGIKRYKLLLKSH